MAKLLLVFRSRSNNTGGGGQGVSTLNHNDGGKGMLKTVEKWMT
jgi:hypothetical protein